MSDDFAQRRVERTRQAREDPRSTQDIISTALAEMDEHKRWDLVVLLHHRATSDVLEAGRSLCESECPDERILGADILGQLGVPDRVFPDECLGALLPLLEREDDWDVFSSVCSALGQLHDPRAIPDLAAMKAHPSENVRFAVTLALGGYEDDLAVRTLIELTEDVDADVRDWATFGLGSRIDLDTPAIREALFRRLTDSDNTTRSEAMVGLARRKDQRVVAALLEQLAPERMALLKERPDLPIEAAEEVADPRLLPALLRLRAAGWEDNGYLDQVIDRCREGR